MATSDKMLYQLALTMVSGIGDITARNILQAMGDAENIFKATKKNILSIPGITANIATEIQNPEALRKAERELEFIEKHNIEVYFISDKTYPSRLRDCADAPVLLYYKGNADLNTQRIISIVGTRNATAYGNDFCRDFLQQLAVLSPDTLIVSGLAYGIDIQAHRNALANNLPTVGVLAHGLDRIYPSSHKSTATQMVEQGGLLTDFPSGTDPERYNFVRRNRIVAGLADALIVVESDEKGGSLITAEIAGSYCKDVFAVPGKMTDRYSRGCNHLIASHKADLFRSTEYFLEQIGWSTDQPKKKNPVQKQLFLDLSVEQQSIVDALNAETNLQMDLIAIKSGIAVHKLPSILLQMEMLGVIRCLPGNAYALV